MSNNHPLRIVTCAEPNCTVQVETYSNHAIIRCPTHRAEHIRQARNKWARERANSSEYKPPVERPHKKAWWHVVQQADCPEAFPLGAKFSPEEISQMEIRGSFDPGMVIERGGVRKQAVMDGGRQRLVEL